MKIGYARVSSSGQNLQMQIDAFEKAGCEKIFIEKQSALKKRPELEKALELLRPGDIFTFGLLIDLGGLCTIYFKQ
jgi:DNA invertase Pin-like site-specific DNA recombinase